MPKKMSNSLVILIIMILIVMPHHHSSSITYDCCFNSTYAYRDDQYVSLTDFNSFSQLKFNCGSTSIQMSIWEIMPFPDKLILDDSFSQANISIEPLDLLFSIQLNNLKGFRLNSNPFRDLNVNQVIWWRFENSKLEFFLNETLLEKHSCSENLVEWALIKTIRVLSLNKGTTFSSDQCPFIFKNADLYMLSLGWISSSLIGVNIFTFQNITAPNLNSSIYQLHVNFYHADLNSKILNEFVFEKLQVLDLNGPINSIQKDLFVPFNDLRLLRLRSQNVRKLFSQQNQWLELLNLKRNKYFTLVIYQAFSNVTFYEYPDEDFCHFKSFPHQNRVLPILKPTFRSKCTCLELFLIQYSADYSKSIQLSLIKAVSYYSFAEFYSDVIFEKKFSKCVNSSFQKAIQDCDFAKRLNLCQIKEANKTDRKEENDFVFYVYDWIKMGEIIQMAFPKYVNLIISLLAVVLNIVMIIILSNKKMVSDKMYIYLLINTYFCLFYSLIILIKSIVYHLQSNSKNVIFITSNKILIQYFYLIFGKFLTNFLRTCSNISYFCFILERFIMITSRKGKFTGKFQKLRKIYFLLMTICLATLINIHVFFEFSIINSIGNYGQLGYFIAKRYSYMYKPESMNDYKENFSSVSEYYLLNLANYIRIIFSDLTHIIAATCVDILLLAFIKKKMKTSKVMRANAVIEILSRIQRVKKKRKARRSKDRISQMIILNGVNFLLFRLPLALLSFYGFVFIYNKETMSHEPDLISYIVCKAKQFCAGVQEIFLSFYLFSFFFQSFIFYKLDTNIKISFSDITSKISAFKQRFS